MMNRVGLALLLCVCGLPRIARAQQQIEFAIVSSFPVSEQEETLKKIALYLHSEQPNFGSVRTLRELKDAIAESVPCHIDATEIDIFGLDIEEPIKMPIHSPGRSIGSRISATLSPLELTLQFRYGALSITTIESADSNPEIRVYDISSLVEETQSRTRQRQADRLVRSIVTHVDTDDWMYHGGTSNISILYRGSRTLCVISARTMTQQKTLSLLNSLSKLFPPTESKRSDSAQSALLRRQHK